MPKVVQFHKVSYEQWANDYIEQSNKTDAVYIVRDDAVLRPLYDAIKLPSRGTVGSAGYDFFAPADYAIPFGASRVIPTGICCEFFDSSWFLHIVPRSGQGFKSGIHLANTCGVIDSDYFHAKNGGHIMIKLVNDSAVGQSKQFVINKGDAFAQGIIMPYGLAVDDDATDIRTGGFGSTTNREA